jgi:RNA polymerase sigma-70 factor (ECF subfamily)
MPREFISERSMIEAARFIASCPPSRAVDAGELPVRANVASPIQVLVEAHSDFVWRSLRRLGVPEGLADDATQQVFLVAARKVDAIRSGSERAFLFRTLSHTAAHVRRSIARRREQALADVSDPVDTAPRPDDAASDRQARALLDEALDALPADLRTVFVLFELEELSAPEVAELVGIPLGTVASRLRRAREKFQKAASVVRARALQFPGGSS